MTIRKGTAAVLAAGLLAGCTASPPAGATPPRAPAADPGCPPEGVRLDAGDAEAAMGLRAMTIGLTNCGRAVYRVDGHPALRALDDSRTALDVRVLHDVQEITHAPLAWDGPPAPVELLPGERAAAVVVWRNTYTDVTAPPVEAAHLEVAPAAGRPAAVLTPPGPLDLGSTGRLAVTPWRKTGDAGSRPSDRQPAASEDPIPPLL